jgi:hypothetical protein
MQTLITDDYFVEFDDTDVVDAITCAFNRFNGSLFNNELPGSKVRWASSIRNLRAPGAPVGLLALPEDPVTHRVPNQFRITAPHIFITGKIKGLSPLDEWVLLHEMCHFRVPHHGPEFIDELKRVLDKSGWTVLLGGY